MFKFGNQKPNIKQYAIIGIVLSSIIAALSQCTKIHENNFWDLLNEVQRRYFPQTILNEFILKDPEKLNRRIQRDVDKAIDAVTPEYDRIISDYDKKYKQRYMDLKNDETVCYTDECKALAPPMRICASWINDCQEK
jgi:hypothetical protein